jgi:hypothetical protein
MKRRDTTPRQIAETAQRLREMLSARAADSPETHHATFLYRRPAYSRSVQSHLYFELDGPASAEYRAKLVEEFERCVTKAHEAGPAFALLDDDDRMPTMQWSMDAPSRVCIDIYTTGGVKLWAFEHLVEICFEKAVDGCAVPLTATPATPSL